MSNKVAFVEEIQSKYKHKGAYITLGKAKLDKQVVPEASIDIPLKTLNRHGLIAGATGTGKTKTLQIILEQLSHNGIPSMVMDIKGDLSGIAAEGNPDNSFIKERYAQMNLDYSTEAFPVELMSLSAEKGVRLRSTITEFGPVLFSKILGLNDTQESIISVVFKYCDDNGLPLVDLDDLKKVLLYLTQSDKGKEQLKSEYGSISSASVGAIHRKIVALEQQGAEVFFGEPSFDVHDLLQERDGKGVVNIVRLTDVQNKPNLFSTFMLSLLAEIYATFPEEGDADKPKLCLFIDEAHLVFQEASKTLLDQIETVVKLIRSKGVGVYFITQIPGDVPDEVLSQLGLKIQHALRGFTAKDRKEIKKAVENYPISEYYEADELITQLGIGEAFITALNEKGIPTPLAHTFLISPQSRMDILSNSEIDNLVESSQLAKKYEKSINKESAYEILTEKMDREEEVQPEKKVTSRRKSTREKSFVEEVLGSSAARQVGRTVARELTRSLLGILGVKK